MDQSHQMKEEMISEAKKKLERIIKDAKVSIKVRSDKELKGLIAQIAEFFSNKWDHQQEKLEEENRNLLMGLTLAIEILYSIHENLGEDSPLTAQDIAFMDKGILTRLQHQKHSMKESIGDSF
ncbi:hypothetical protein S40293_11589 [Stachybotrys chartarum IBT 40293]|nr:hypothetical protein S40293_11589 [Stachybotrys chartarum IBT 40293]